MHIAAHNLAVNSAQVLVDFGANTKLKDNLGRIPLGKLWVTLCLPFQILMTCFTAECVPDGAKYDHIPHSEHIIEQLKEILSRETKLNKQLNKSYKKAAESVAGVSTLVRKCIQSLGNIESLILCAASYAQDHVFKHWR